MLTQLAGLLALSRRELIALALLFGLTLPAVTARIYASDEIQYVSYLRSLWFDRDVSFENEYRYFYDRNVGRGEHFHETFLELQTEAGRRPNFGTLGAAILWAPFYALGHVTALSLRALGHEVAADGFSKPYIAAIAYGSAFYAFAAVLLSIAAARRIAASHDRQSIAAGLAVWFGTPLLFYMYVAPPFAHACSAFAVALFVTIWLHVRQTWSLGGAVALGLSGALMAMVREQDVFFAIGPALDLVLTAVKERRVQAAGRRHRLRGVHRRAHPATARLFRAQRTARTIVAGHAENELALATRPRRADIIGARLFRMDAHGNARPGGPCRSRMSRAF